MIEHYISLGIAHVYLSIYSLNLKSAVDASEQYSRRTCLRVSGMQELASESTDSLILDMASAIGADISLADIDRSHRVGRVQAGSTKPRSIIVKFATYRARHCFYSRRASARDNGYRGVFVNEDLTSQRNKLLYLARAAAKAGHLQGAWSHDGTVLVKDMKGMVRRITSPTSIDDAVGIV